MTRDGESPDGTRQLPPAGGAERERAGEERRRPGVVVAAAGGVQGDDRVPAHEGGREPGPRRRTRRGGRGDEHRQGRQSLEDPGRCVLGAADAPGDRLRPERERRPVDRRRLVPRRAHVLEGGIVGVVGGNGLVRVVVVDRRDAAVHPVGPRVAREQQRAGERRELHRDGDRRDCGEGHGRPAQQREPGDVGDQRTGRKREEDPGPGGVALEGSAGRRRERRAARPGRHRRGGHQRDGDRAGGGRAAVATQAAGRARAWVAAGRAGPARAAQAVASWVVSGAASRPARCACGSSSSSDSSDSSPSPV